MGYTTLTIESREREYITNEKFDRVDDFSKLSSCSTCWCVL